MLTDKYLADPRKLACRAREQPVAYLDHRGDAGQGAPAERTCFAPRTEPRADGDRLGSARSARDVRAGRGCERRARGSERCCPGQPGVLGGRARESIAMPPRAGSTSGPSRAAPEELRTARVSHLRSETTASTPRAVSDSCQIMLTNCDQRQRRLSEQTACFLGSDFC